MEKFEFSPGSSEGRIAWPFPTDGGHAFAVVAYDAEGFWIQNSWGPGWGLGGFARIGYDDWLANGTDVWVARLGAPVVLRSRGSERAQSDLPWTLLGIHSSRMDVGTRDLKLASAYAVAREGRIRLSLNGDEQDAGALDPARPRGLLQRGAHGPSADSRLHVTRVLSPLCRG